jgi:urease accessory protein
MDSRAVLRTARTGAGETAVTELRSQAPQILRTTGHDESGIEVHLMGGAAGPLGGDDWDLRIDVGDGSAVRLRSVAATLAQPDPRYRESRSRVQVTVGAGAQLDAWCEPVISVGRSRHRLEVAIDVAMDARFRWVDEIRWGRHDEEGGEITLAQRVTVAGAVLAMQRVEIGPDAPRRGFGAQGDGRLVVTAVGDHGGGSDSIVDTGVRAVRCDLGNGWASWSALGSDRERLHHALRDLGLGEPTRHGWVPPRSRELVR